MEIDSGVWPGVSRTLRRTRPNSRMSPLRSGSKRVRRFSRGAEIDGRAHAIAQLQMPGNEIGVEMRQEYVLDLERVLGGKGDVLVGVALRVNDGCRARLLVSDHVGSVRQARQIELLEDHTDHPLLTDCHLGRGMGRGGSQPLHPKTTEPVTFPCPQVNEFSTISGLPYIPA